MAATSDYLEQAILNALFRGQSLPQPDPVYVALYTASPADDNSGAEVTGSEWTNYARESVATTSGSSGFDAPTTDGSGGYEVLNSAAVDFGTATVSGTQADVTHFGILDASTGGNLLHHGALDTAKSIVDGIDVKFPAGSLAVGQQ